MREIPAVLDAKRECLKGQLLGNQRQKPFVSTLSLLNVSLLPDFSLRSTEKEKIKNIFKTLLKEKNFDKIKHKLILEIGTASHL
ncbi:MAG: RP853 family protein [Rickettsia endosymbiont of Ixodes persulcatus]|nr:RP853 family protein [Rickettsia endosymbiont of Ixodes persulcatus]